MRRAAKRDLVEPSIVAALEAAGWLVYRTLPTDLLCYKAGVWRVLEAKTPKNKRGDPRHDKRQVKQDEFIALTGTPRVTSAEQALMALGSTARAFYYTHEPVRPYADER